MVIRQWYKDWWAWGKIDVAESSTERELHLFEEENKKSALQVEEYARQREIKIRPYVEYAQHAVFREIGRPAIAHGLHKSAMMRAIIEYIEMYIETNGSYPKGKHTVQRLVHASPWGSNKHYQDETVEFPD